MQRGSVRPVRLRLIAGLCLFGLSAFAARGQSDSTDAALRDRVLQLVERLDAPKPEARDAAMASLTKLGPKILPILPDPATLPAGNRKERIEQLRAALRKSEDDVNPSASRITLVGKGIRLTEALQQLQKQTGNAIADKREELGAEVTNPALDLEIRDKPFLEALDLVARQAEVGIDFHTGDGSVGIVGGGTMSKSPIVYSGPFRIEMKQIGEVRDFAAGSSTATVTLEAAWEPRLRPMLLKLKADELKILDDHGKVVKSQVEMESDEVVVRPENPVAEINLNLQAPERSASKFKTLSVKADVTIPAGIKVFRFPSLTQENVTVKQGDVSVTLQGTEVDEQVWKVNVELAYPGEGPAFESYRQGLFNNRLWLQRADGSRFEHNGGFSNTGGSGGRLGFEYLFVDAPGKPADYQLVYETPSKVITIPLEFEFKDVPLP
ncbi:MAG: hypothetical protein ACLQGP_29235 [Isosphaeraceae bacterium]